MNNMHIRARDTTLEATYADLMELLEIIVDKNGKDAVFDVHMGGTWGKYSLGSNEQLRVHYSLDSSDYLRILYKFKRFFNDIEGLKKIAPMSYDISITVPVPVAEEEEELPHPEDCG